LEVLDTLRRERKADESPSVHGHEVDGLRRDLLGRHHEVALVLAVLVIDDKRVLEEIGNIKSRISVEFLRENYQQLSFSEEELVQKKIGMLGAIFPEPWRDPAKLDEPQGQNGRSSG
jgi:hypothetical protein